MSVQTGWASCPKCQGMHFAGFPSQGACPAGGQHDKTNSFPYMMTFDVPSSDHVQTGWASCPKCQGMHFAGFPSQGACPAGGQHDKTNSFAYALTHDLPATQNVQAEWRACPKCQGLFFGPFSGVCPAGGQHSADGSFNYLVPFSGGLAPDTAVFDSGPLTSSLALGGSAHVAVRGNGDFTFSCHAHDSGFDNIDYAIVGVLLTTNDIAFTFAHSGSTEGTSAGLPLGTPRRDDDFTTSGNNPMITTEFGGMNGALWKANLTGRDLLVHGIAGALEDLLAQVVSALGKAAAAAVVALVV
jgi:hypothetical protein